MYTRKLFGLLAAAAALMLVSLGTSRAGNQTLKIGESGSFIEIPLDPDGDSCTTSAGGVTSCTDFSVNGTFAGTGAGLSNSTFVGEYDGVAGTGCTIGGAAVPIAGCTLSGSNETGCQFKSVGEAVIYTFSSGDQFFTTESDTVCEDFSSLPFNYSVTVNQATITGGTGKFAGATGSVTGGGHGQALLSDPTGHGFGWFQGTAVAKLTTP